MLTDRAVERADLGRLHELIVAVESAERAPYTLSQSEVEEFLFGDDDVQAASDSRWWLIGDEPVAWGLATHHPSGVRFERSFLMGGVHPAHTGNGLGRHVLAWLVQRGTEQLAGSSPELPAYLGMEAYSWQTARERLARRAGFNAERWFDELQRPLADLPPIEPIDGIDIRQWQPDDVEPARQVFNAAFADHWGTTERSAGSWASNVVGAYGRRLDLSFVAVGAESQEVIGFALNGHYPDDHALTGRHDGWVDSVGTLRSHRRRGIASALIVRSMHAFVAAGLDSTMLGVDTDSPTGAYGIYEALGYRPLQRLTSLIKWVRPE